MTVLAGGRLEDWKYEGGPDCEFDWPKEAKMFWGLELEADCELSCVKAREELLRVAARGQMRVDASCGREDRIMLEAVEAVNLVRDAIVSADGGDGEVRLVEL